MSVVVRGLFPALALLAALSVIVDAAQAPTSARSELQLELADLLVQDNRYWESIPAYSRAKVGGTPEQIERASVGLLRSLLFVAEFDAAYGEARFLEGLNPQDPERRVLYADGIWASGLFDEAEGLYREVLAAFPSSPGARHGVAKSLASRSQYEAALREVQAALAEDPGPPEYQFTLASIYRNLRRYDEAAEALDRFVAGLGGRLVKNSDLAQSQAIFLRSFGDRVPFEMPGGDDRVYTLPYRLIDDKLIVRASINGRDPIDMVIDSGAEQMVLTPPTALGFGIESIGTMISAGVGDVGFRDLELGRADSLRIGDFEVHNLPVIIKNPPLTGLPDRRVRNSISPIALGLSIRIDYRSSHLILAKSLPDEPIDIELPMRVNRLAVVRGVINGVHPKSFVVDTGGEVISISLAAARGLETKAPRHIPLRVYGTSGWDTDAYVLPGINLSFHDQIKYENFSAVVLNLHRPSALLGFRLGGIIGHAFLSNYVVSMDLERSMLGLRVVQGDVARRGAEQ